MISHWDADIEHSLWVQWWFATALESPEHALFRTDMVDFPHVVDLQLADLNLAINLAGYALGKLLSPGAAYNVLLLLGFLLSGELMRRLLLWLGAEHGAAWLGGLCYAASPYWLACVLNGWGYLVHTWVLPLVFLALLAVRDAPSALRGAGVGLALGLCFHVTPYYFLYGVVLLAVLAPWFAGAGRAWLRAPGALPACLLGVATLVLVVAPRAIGMASAAGAEVVAHHGPLNTVLAGPLFEWLLPSASAVEGRLPRLGYLVVFLGYTVVGTLAVGLLRGGARRTLVPWLVSGGLLLLLSLGPALKLVDGPPTALPLPAALLQRLPVFELTTNHWRWTLPAGFCLVVAFSLALSALVAGAEARRAGAGRLLVAGLVVAFAFEVAFVWPLPRTRPLWELRTHPVAEQLREREDVRAVLDRTDRRKLNQTVHGKAIALGWLPRLAVETRRANEAMVRACEGRPPGCLRRYGIDAVLRDDGTALLLGGSAGAEILRAR